MKTNNYIITLFAILISCSTTGQVLRAFSPRYSNPSVRGNIVFVSNNSITSSGVNTTETPPGGTAVNNGNAGANINITGTTLIPFGSVWKYYSTGVAPAGAWTSLGYNDVAWLSGASELGYGDADEATCIPSGGGGTLCTPTGNKYITSYFRKTINIPNASLYGTYQFNVERDDGYVVYVNGTEVARNNMPAGPVVYATAASSAIEDAVISFSIANTFFVNGNNDIAVEIHQANATSSDLSFNLELTGADPAIFNSSSADLSLPSCTQVLFAGLYWGASQGTDGTNTSWITNETSVKLKIPGSAIFQDLSSTQTDYHNNTLVPGLPHTGYRCFIDVTSLINTLNPNGTYTVANLASPAGIINASGGWTIVIVYADPATIVRNLTVFDGSAIMNGGDPPLYVPITGFLTPPSGPVSCELGAVVFDGDRVSTDEYSFKQNSNPLVGVYTSLTPNATANLNDMWNSTISYKGAVVTTRNPAHQNTLGYDADILVVPNALNAVLGNSQNSASIRFSSPSENYMLQVATTSISQYTPSFNLSKTSTDINGGSLLPGEQLRYDITYQNGGNDISTGTIIYDNIPTGTSYKANSLQIGGIAKTDATGDDEAEYDFANNRVVFRIGTGANGTTGGEVSPAASGTVRFEVYVANSCDAFACNNTISNRAWISYAGKLSLINLADSSGVMTAGCNVPGPVTNTVAGTCSPLIDTILVNNCPSVTVLLPVIRYAGYRFYTAMPFTASNEYNPAVPVSLTRHFYAFYDGPGSCDDTLDINVFIIACPDIDDDDDGIPDYVELDNPVALQDADTDGIPNWNDNNYPGYIDNNADGFNDNFDPGADSDADGIPNFYDTNFPGWVDSNSDGVNDTMDKDLDGIPNNLDLDSDNDGIPDVVESFGVDANGDGRIDNYTETDNDGLSQNVDANNTGVAGSGLALGALDTDGDGIGNYLDLDSDNDGIPDVAEVYGTDTGNNGRIDNYTDSDGDGYTDTVDGDVGNDGTAENAGSSLLRTSNDGNNDGRADSFPYKNIDRDSKPNPYDLDSDGDGLTDVREAQFADADFNGRIDGVLNSDGWNSGIASSGSLSLPNTDGTGRYNLYDIDADDDGIPDNVEGMSTPGYLLPVGLDSDNDGIDNTYDNFAGFGGNGVAPYDNDGDTVPDYLDLDTDNDGVPDIIEGNDFNFNGFPDDNVSLTGIDTDDDGLDDRFDNNNLNAEATSAYMGNGGTTSGDPTPGSVTTVQHTAIASGLGCPVERDWRCIWYILSCDIISFKAVLQDQQVVMDWETLCRQSVDHFVIERSTDGSSFNDVIRILGRSVINETELYTANDNIPLIHTDKIYYRLRTILTSGKVSKSSIIVIQPGKSSIISMQIAPNLVKDRVQLFISCNQSCTTGITIYDASGKIIYQQRDKILPGSTTIQLSLPLDISNGIYYLSLDCGGKLLTSKFVVFK